MNMTKRREWKNFKKKKKLYTIQPKETKRCLVIDQNKLNLQKIYHHVDFRTGRHLIEKDRPRKRYKPHNINLDD